MKRSTVLFAGLAAGCLGESQPLLCASDADCDEGQRCELVSGLCVPALSPPSATGGGISGAFECRRLGATPGVRAPGLASVVLRPPDRDESCEGGPAGELAGLEAGCRLTRERIPRVRGSGPGVEFWVLSFEQFDGDPRDPAARLTLHVRVDAAEPGTLAAPDLVSAQYFERCTRGESRQLRLRFVSTQGSLQLTGADEAGLAGTFDLNLRSLRDGAGFGTECPLPSACLQGDCALVELGTDQCSSGSCLPDPRDPTPDTGACSGRCEDHRDCGFDPEANPEAYCLIPPGRTDGACLRLCDPNDDECPQGTSCRPGSDFEDFPGGGGPARCLDACIPTASTPAAAPCPRANQDAGVRDSGPPADGGRPHDAGPGDGGVDAGVSPLGAACAPNAPCPAGWFCAQARPGPLGASGFCSRACMNDGVCRVGYAGPGEASCRPAVRNLQSMVVVNPACLIACGADFGQDGRCPAGLSCGDVFDNTTGMPPADGRDDICVE